MANMEELIEDIVPPVMKGIMDALGGSLPDPDLVSYYALENDRKLYLDTDVDESLLEMQRMIMRWNIADIRSGKPREELKPIWIYIMSYGGDVDYMWALIDTIQSSYTPIYTVNLGMAGSAAGLIFVSGEKRYMTKRSKVIIHEGSAQFQGDAIKVMDATESYAKTLKDMKEFILSKTKIPRRKLMEKRSNDWSLDSAYCLEHGVCDVVVDSLKEII